MTHSASRVLVLLTLVLNTPTAFAEDGENINYSNGKYVPLVGVTSSVGSDVHHGPEVGVANLFCGREGLCLAFGGLLGVVRPKVYSTGLGAGAIFFPATTWLELAAQWTDGRVSGYHASLALGVIVMPYVGANYQIETRHIEPEFGVTAKWLLGVR